MLPPDPWGHQTSIIAIVSTAQESLSLAVLTILWVHTGTFESLHSRYRLLGTSSIVSGVLDTCLFRCSPSAHSPLPHVKHKASPSLAPAIKLKGSQVTLLPIRIFLLHPPTSILLFSNKSASFYFIFSGGSFPSIICVPSLGGDHTGGMVAGEYDWIWET